MPDFKSKDPLHGVTLENLLTELVAQFGIGRADFSRTGLIGRSA